MHGGIGKYIESLNDIREIKRPIGQYSTEGKWRRFLLDLLWSDPATRDMERDPNFNEENVRRGENIYFFGQDRLDKFLKDNNLTCLIRAHEMVDGVLFELENKCITLFSALNYMGRLNEAGCLFLSYEYMSRLKLTCAGELKTENLRLYV